MADPALQKATKLPAKAAEFLQKLLTSWKGSGFPGKPRYFYKHDSMYRSCIALFIERGCLSRTEIDG